MKKLAYEIRFVTPAFLGDAEQNGRWRTPPLKALLRQWWRVAYAADNAFQVDIADMRTEEGLLFGNAWLSHREGNREVNDYCRSLVRIRLGRWDQGSLRSWQGLEQAPVNHPEAQRANYRVGPHAYLGYGPLDARGGTRLEKRNAAIQAGESASFSIAVPDEHALRIQRVLWLIDRYGTLGSRSRNGWGSFSLTPIEDTPTLASDLPLRIWQDALRSEDWPHALGQDERGALVWQTKHFADWKQLMSELATVKIGLRTQFVFPNVRLPHQNVEPRHWLSYPITTHSTRAWRGNARLPNSLRFKVRPDSNDPEKVVGVIFHMPCLPPPEFHPNQTEVVQTWQAVHALLDELTRPADSRTYASITDVTRRTSLKTQLNTVNLTRITE